ncbi:TetR/AcrR family transcriptional regulator [Streptomyces angustmyceticus]|uniref:TetR family transcriptional regulator n=1 Tax=Streptomyces angustmyceticus TaxID=285578 RepID=A0A5J4L3K2_9ACTN|nr:TetR/AcrR family transcriptional regulator [Streptomyces angustmyceticus]UAL66243.1 TetR/AcrR family transcriptional regulator [Streptomyces angustmyceticus]GES28997.1 TetR family transcriptional regulator [Streptomyces angustmyceticus]
MTDTRRRRVPRPVREQQIIDAAIGVFAKRGYHAASVEEIAELAGVSKPMVYLYLDSKEGLFLACLRRETERLVSALRAAAGPVHGPELRLRAGLLAFFTFVTGHRDSWVVLHRQAAELSPAIAAELARTRRAVVTEVSGLVRAGDAADAGPACPDDEADFVTYALVGAADSLTDWMTLHPEEPPERITLRLMNMVWVGMRNVLDGEVWTTPGREP